MLDGSGTGNVSRGCKPVVTELAFKAEKLWANEPVNVLASCGLMRTSIFDPKNGASNPPVMSTWMSKILEAWLLPVPRY